MGINYKATDDYRAALDDAAPDGVDAYFDNVGGPITDAVFTRLNTDARVAVCGQIALYNSEGIPTGPRKLTQVIQSRATVEGLLVSDFEPRFGKRRSSSVSGSRRATSPPRDRRRRLENAPDAFLGLFAGENIGKQLVQVVDR